MAPMNGRITRLVSEKGFGFILARDGNKYFSHDSARARTRFDDLRDKPSRSSEDKGQSEARTLRSCR